jgi:hypothetical protein
MALTVGIIYLDNQGIEKAKIFDAQPDSKSFWFGYPRELLWKITGGIRVLLKPIWSCDHSDVRYALAMAFFSLSRGWIMITYGSYLGRRITSRQVRPSIVVI